MKIRSQGVTLIELLVVIAVVGILAVISTGSYRGYVMRTNRGEGRNAIMRIQVAEEKFFLQNDTYTTNFTGAPPAGLGFPATTTQTGKFTLTVAPGSTGAIGTSYLITATAAGGQATDIAACRVFSIDDQGRRVPNDASGCWK